MLSGVEAESVIELVRRRIGDPARQATGNRRIGLVVEGGAMRGVYTAGSLLGLHHVGAAHAFDAAYGTSAGALNLAHFLSGEGPNKIAAYYQILTSPRFYNPKRIHKVVDIDYLVKKVMREDFPLEFDKLWSCPTVFKVGVLNYDSAEGEVVELPRNEVDAWKLLHATVALPILYNRTVEFRGSRYSDGGMIVPFPLRQAISDGMTDILVLLTHNPAIAPDPRAKTTRALYRTLFAKKRSDLMKVFDGWPEQMRSLQMLLSGEELPDPPVRIAVIAPRSELIPRTAMDRDILRGCCEQMAAEVLRIFGQAEEVTLPA
jgi:predicted patatin/cPLA2 family phospholipase